MATDDRQARSAAKLRRWFRPGGFGPFWVVVAATWAYFLAVKL